MNEDAPTPDLDQIAGLHSRALRRAPFLKGRLTPETFALGVGRSVAHRFRDDQPEPDVLAAYINSLRIEDLALAVACEAGDERAWEHVVITYRPILYRAASVLTGDDVAGCELADTLWAELYGVGRTCASMESGGERRSLLAYYHGRAKLSSWLRSVLAQRHVDVIRARQRCDSLDTGDESPRDGPTPASKLGAGDAADVEPDRARYAAACRHSLHAALMNLDPGDRLRLSCYYVQELKLAEIGQLCGEHEATVSRKLSRARKRVRRDVERLLRDTHRLTPAEIELCYQYMLDTCSMIRSSTWQRASNRTSEMAQDRCVESFS